MAAHSEEILAFSEQRRAAEPDNAAISNLFLARFSFQLIDLSGQLFGLISEGAQALGQR